jgi:putative ABC transport system permease protein
MLPKFLHNQIALGAAQAVCAAALALAVAVYARRRGIHLVQDISVSLVRGISQIILVGLILAVLLKGPWWTGPIMLAAMVAAAGKTSSRRAKGFPGALRISLYAIGFGAGTTILLMTVAGVIDRSAASLVPIGSMLIANAMNANALVMDRFRSEVESHIGEIETALALGAASDATVGRYVHNALRASLIPPVDNLRTLGIVWIPGLMAGMILSGSSPLYASIYQFVVLAMIFGSAGMTCMFSTHLMQRRAFTAAEQLAPELVKVDE